MRRISFSHPPSGRDLPYNGFWSWERIQLGIIIALVSSLLAGRFGPDWLQVLVHPSAILLGLRWSYLLVSSDFDYQIKFGFFLFFAATLGGFVFFVTRFFL